MKIRIKPAYGAIAAATAVLTFSACAGDSNNQNNNQQNEVKAAEESNTFYLIPSPNDLFAFTQNEKLQYSAELLNPIANADKYIDNQSKEFNFGTFSADMAYSAAFGKYQESVKYLNQIRNLSDQIGIGNVFNDALINRIDQVANNKDSLKSISNDTYLEIITALDGKKRNRTMALISAGGWLESLYIVTQSIDKYDPADISVQQVADQKLVLENLIQYFNQIKDDPAVAQTLKEFEPLKNAYSEIKREENAETQNPPEGAIAVGGSKKLKISEENFNKIKETIAQLRNKLTANNVSN